MQSLAQKNIKLTRPKDVFAKAFVKGTNYNYLLSC